ALIRGVELEHFMSYEHAYVPLSQGLNLILGPNGAGKSSILLAISLVLGQSHTERSKRLADLIRWGREEARITLELENKNSEGRRLFPHRKGATVAITRRLRARGDYAYYLDGRPITKGEVQEALSDLGIYPDNMLIIMHQLMVHRFASVSPQEKLAMLEEAVGFREYRKEVTEALDRLKRASEEERTLHAILESTRESYEYWRREYEKYQRKVALEERMGQLEAALAWTRVAQREASVSRLEERSRSLSEELEGMESQRSAVREKLQRDEAALVGIKEERRRLEGQRVGVAKAIGRVEVGRLWREALGKDGKRLSGDVEELAGGGEDLEELLAEEERLDEGLRGLEAEMEAVLDDVIDGKVEDRALRFQARFLAEELERVERALRAEREEVAALMEEAEKLGARCPPRRVAEIKAEMADVKEDMAPLVHLSEEVEKVYAGYAESFEGLQERAETIAQHRKILEEELSKRMKRWKEALRAFLRDLERDFNQLLQEAEGKGEVRLRVGRDVEKAGLDIRVGFRRQKPLPLESFAQSGGERSIALTAFLLALQRRITSPFRAIDEFDVHLDPRNREVIAGMIMAGAKDMGEVQYVAITPGPVGPPEDVNVIVVQSVAGDSKVGRLT
ncbi:MAG: AAA family ATPase, partial [Thermoplasmata archaeon]